jgi:hypothetical protein
MQGAPSTGAGTRLKKPASSKAETILTLHPEGKKGVRVKRELYNVVRTAINTELRQRGPTPFRELMEAVTVRLGPDFPGSPGWYYTSVKLDLEARAHIRCDRSGKVQVVSLP